MRWGKHLFRVDMYLLINELLAAHPMSVKHCIIVAATLPHMQVRSMGHVGFRDVVHRLLQVSLVTRCLSIYRFCWVAKT
jgi:uncharacterized protein (DUF2336 family)